MMYRAVFNLKFITWAILVSVLYVSIFDSKAQITNDQIGIAIMLLLIALFADLKEFDFWGLKGKKPEKDLKSLEGEAAIPSEDIKIDTQKLQIPENSSPPLQLMDTSQGNFLALAFEVERLLRVFASVGLAKDIPNNVNLKNLAKDLRSKDLLTDVGVQQVDAISWLRNILVHGRQQEINQATLEAGIEVATGLYKELYQQLYGELPEIFRS